MAIRRIDVGFDFSQHAELAASHAAALARAHGGTLRLVHASWPMAHFSETTNHTLIERFELLARQERLDIEKGLDRTSEELAGSGDLEVSHAVVEGRPADALAEAAGSLDSDLLVLGSHGRTGVKRFLLGSVAEQTTRGAPCSVLVARGEAPAGGRYRNIVVATDFGEASQRAVDQACELIAPDGALTLLHCWEPPIIAVETPAIPPPYDLSADIERAARDAGKRQLERAQQQGTRATLMILEGPPASTIHDVLDESGADLVVVGTHGRSGIRRWLLGSVAELTIRHAASSVLVARPR